jgi:hypothetical protein
VHNLLVKVQEIMHKYLKIIYVDENVKIGHFWYNRCMMDIFFITAAAVVIYGIAYLLETETFKK